MNLRRMVAVAAIWISAGITGCHRNNGLPSSDLSSVKLWITKDGIIEMDGKPTTLDVLSVQLSDLARRKGMVLYGRDAPDEEPHPNGMKVIELVAQNRLPIRMSTKRDFSDAMGSNSSTR